MSDSFHRSAVECRFGAPRLDAKRPLVVTMLSMVTSKQWARRQIDSHCEVFMLVKELPIALDQEKIATFCQERGIRKLSLFGSVLHNDFTPTSDIDVLIEYWSHRFPGWDLFLHAYELSQLVGKEVDLNLPTMLSPYFRDEVLREAVTIYEQT